AQVVATVLNDAGLKATWQAEVDAMRAHILTMRQMFVNILPNCLAPLIVQASLGFSNAILDMAALGFLGMGAQPPTPEWGTMLSDVLQFAQSAWWVVTFPGVAILLTVLAFNLMGDGLRDALDPKLKQ
ncbi:ABC transporter permease subunit, partial [Klebsiella pneumoniae]